MKVRSSAGIFFALLATLIGCGREIKDISPDHEPVSEITTSEITDICDGSATVRAGIRQDLFHNIADIQHFFYEGGGTFLYVTGKCEIWVGGECPNDWGASSTVWCGYRRTAISHEALVALLNNIGWPEWRTHDGESIGTPSSTSVYTVFGPDFSLTFRPESIISDDRFSRHLQRWHDEVDRITQTAELGMTPLRVVLTEMSPGNAELYDDERHVQIEWPSSLIDPTPASLAERQSPYCIGNSFKVPADAEDSFRASRERFWAETNGSNFITAVDGDRRFFLWMRDTLPFEDSETGLLDVGPYSEGDCVGGFGVDFPD